MSSGPVSDKCVTSCLPYITIAAPRPPAAAMKGKLELKGKYWLNPSRRYWFVLDHVRLDYYSSKDAEDRVDGGPLGTIRIRDVLHVETSLEHKRSINIITTKRKYVVKSRSGNDIHNWMGEIKEKVGEMEN